MEEKVLEMTEETDIIQEHIEQFKRSFSKLVHNRSVLCDENGNLRAGNERYKSKYLELLNLVAKQGTQVISDSISYYYIPKTQTGVQFKIKLESIVSEMSANFKSAIFKGTYEDFMKLLEIFKDSAATQYVIYITQNGMHDGII